VDASTLEDAQAGGAGNLLMATRSEVADWIGAEAAESRESSVQLDRVSSIEAATAIVFATDAGTLASALASPAGLVLAPASLKSPESETDTRILWLRDPRYGFAAVAQRLTERTAAEIHATAVVSPLAEVGGATSIGPGAVVYDGVKLGRQCEIGPNVTIYANVTIGDLGAKGFGYARNAATGAYVLFPQQGVLVIEDDVDIGANTTIDRGALGETRIGSGTKIDNLVHIGHNCVIGRNVIIAAQTGISGSSVVEDGAILGGQVGIGEHATVGAGVILGGGAGVLTGKKMHGSGEVFWGRPARPLKEYLRDLARLKRR
jgi:UDP-3-O-[3-hydroxymyristoyl] glucosamine N-acyltransferase